MSIVRDKTKGRVLAVSTAILAVVLMGSPQAAHAASIGGTFKWGPPTAVGCTWSVECFRWRTGVPGIEPACLPANAPKDGIQASIVAVPSSFHNQTKTYRAVAVEVVGEGRPKTLFSFYNAQCNDIGGGVRVFPGVDLGVRHSVRVPSAAHWIGVFGYNVANVTWTLS